MIKLKNMSWEEYCELPGWAKCNQKGSYKSYNKREVGGDPKSRQKI